MRVLLLTTSFPICAESLSGIFVARLADSLAENMEITVVTPAYKKATGRVRKDNVLIVLCRYAKGSWQRLAHEPGGLPVALRGSPWKWLLIPGLLLSLGWHGYRESRYSDLLHANWTLCGCIAGLIGFLNRKAVITTFRGDDVARASRYRIDYALLKLCVLLSHRVVCVSEEMRNWLSMRFPKYAHKIVLIENGVGEEFLRIGKKRSSRLSNDDSVVRFITVGSLIPRKGMDLIIEAFSNVLAEINVELIIVGSGPEELRLKALVRKKNAIDQISFLNIVSPENLPAELARADVFILASHSEGRPNVLLEAMASGLPVIASDISGVRELIEHEHTGLLFSDGNLEQLAEHIRYLAIDTQMRNKLGPAGRGAILRRGLTWRNCAQKYREIYQQITNS